MKLLLAIGVLNALFTICQYRFPNVTRPFQELFAMGDRHIDLLSEQGRAFGFFVNPNTNAVMLLLLAVPSVALFRLTSQFRYLVLGSFVMATIVLTGSRTGLVLAAVAIVVLCVASRKFSYLIVLAPIAWGAYESLEFLVRTGAVRDWFPYLAELLLKIDGALHGDGFDLASVNSFHSRLENWELALDWYRTRPWLGCGPLREVLPSFVDNYYVYLLSRYGLVGLSLYALYSVYVAALAIAALLRRSRPQSDWALVALTSVVVVNVANYTMDAFIIVPIGSVCLLYSGFMVSLMDMSRTAPKMRRQAGSVPRRRRILPQMAGPYARLAFFAVNAPWQSQWRGRHRQRSNAGAKSFGHGISWAAPAVKLALSRAIPATIVPRRVARFNVGRRSRETPMRVWLLHIGEDLPVDGAVRRFRYSYLAEALAERGHDVLRWAPTFRHNTKRHRFADDRRVEVGPRYAIQFVHSPGYRRNVGLQRLRAYRALGRRIRGLMRREQPPDVLVAAIPSLEWADAAVAYGRARSIPVIVDVRDPWPDVFSTRLAIFHAFGRAAAVRPLSTPGQASM